MNKRDIRFAVAKVPRHQMVLYPQSLDQVILADAPVRRLAALLDEIDWGTWEQAYTGWGQPPIHPRYMAGAILLGLLRKVLSTRELEEAACKHVDFIWLFEGHTPDHSTFAKFRKRHGDAIEELHKHIAKMLVMKREKALLHLIIDGTRLRADSDRQGARTAKTIEFIIGELERRMDELKRNDEPEIARQTEYFDGMEPPQDEEDKTASACPNKENNSHAPPLYTTRKSMPTTAPWATRSRSTNAEKTKTAYTAPTIKAKSVSVAPWHRTASKEKANCAASPATNTNPSAKPPTNVWPQRKAKGSTRHAPPASKACSESSSPVSAYAVSRGVVCPTFEPTGPGYAPPTTSRNCSPMRRESAMENQAV